MQRFQKWLNDDKKKRRKKKKKKKKKMMIMMMIACVQTSPLPQKKGNLSKDVFERRTSTGSEAFSLFIRLDANKFVVIIFFSLIKTIYPRI